MPFSSQSLHTKKAQIFTAYAQKRQPHIFFVAHTKLVRQTLSALWQQHFPDSPFALLALGGFGRGELYPYSDIDLAIVSTDTLNTTQNAQISKFIQTLWDYGLQPAAQIGSRQELLQVAHDDLSADTAFLEGNFICGDNRLAQSLLTGLNSQRDVIQFTDAKILEQEQRHLKTQASGSLLEPNIKTCPGGLRDVHTLIWLARAQGLNPNFNNLVKQRVLTEGEARLLLYSHKQLAKLRIDLHLAAKRAQEFFIFDLQTYIATQWALQDDEKQIKSEKLMQQLFHATKAVKQLNGILLPILRSRIYSSLPRVTTNIDDQFYSIGNLLAIKDKTLFAKQPSYIFKTFSILQTHRELNGIAPKTLRALWNQRKSINSKFIQSPVNRHRFIQFFIHGDNLTHTLRRLNLYGILGRYLPSFGKIVGLMQYDLFHIYPVDEHILMVVSNLRRFDIESYSHEFPKMFALMQTFEHKHILYLAALFHDIAKGRHGSHSVLGAVDAQVFAENHFLNSEETELLMWLVAEHLSFSYTAQKEDIHNPEVIDRFCEKIQTEERLVALYLLTVADIRGTNPKLWNSWRAALLESLFEFTLAQLRGNKIPLQTLKQERQKQALHLWDEAHASIEAQENLKSALGDAYFVRHQSEEILWHTQNILNKETQDIVSSRILNDTQTLQVMVYTADKPYLFARICQFLSMHNFNIVEAKIFTTANSFALDTFILQNTKQEITESIAQNLQKKLDKFLQQHHQNLVPKTQGKSLLDRPSRRQRHFPIAPKITLTPEENDHLYSLEIVAGDRQGLLAGITRVLAQFKVEILYAKISTLGERAEDRFLVQSSELEDAKTQLALKNALIDELTQ